MKNLDLQKLFGSNCRKKILEKFFLEYKIGNSSGFHMRGLSRDLEEQINSIKREVDNLYELGLLKFRSDNQKKVFYLNKNFPIFDEMLSIFEKTYNPISLVKTYFSDKKDLKFIMINDSLESFMDKSPKNSLDIFLIGELDKEHFANFLSSVFFGRKIRFAVLSLADYEKRIEYGDKLIGNILSQRGNIVIKNELGI